MHRADIGPHPLCTNDKELLSNSPVFCTRSMPASSPDGTLRTAADTTGRGGTKRLVDGVIGGAGRGNAVRSAWGLVTMGTVVRAGG